MSNKIITEERERRKGQKVLTTFQKINVLFRFLLKGNLLIGKKASKELNPNRIKLIKSIIVYNREYLYEFSFIF